MCNLNFKKHFKKTSYLVSLILFLFPVMAFAQQTSTTSSVGIDALQMLVNLSANYPALWQLVTAVCYLFGFGLAMLGVYYLKLYGELRTMMSTQTSLRTPVTLFIAAAALLYIPTTFQLFSQTVFGYNSPLAYSDVTSSIDPIVLKAIVGLVQFVGLVSFVRGWMIIVAHAKQAGGGGQASLGKGLTHIIGGLLAINVLGLADIIWNTFGFTFHL